MTRRDTRRALLDAGVELFLEGGYDFAGMNAILAHAKAPRGSFYHHFADKQAFALAVAEHYYESHLPALDRSLGDDARPPLARLRRYFEQLIRDLGRANYRGGCVLGVLAQELAERDAGASKLLAGLFGRWRHRIADCLREAREQRQLDPEIDCDEAAAFVLDAWEGALIQMKVKRAGAPLERFMTFVFDRLLTS